MAENFYKFFIQIIRHYRGLEFSEIHCNEAQEFQ